MKISQISMERAVLFQSEKGDDRHEPGYIPHVTRAFRKHLKTSHNYSVWTLYMIMLEDTLNIEGWLGNYVLHALEKWELFTK